ncbi:Ubiquitin-associated domain/translation elongation factor EF-Ts [Quillaja saponaria]|uniref:Ubiquitin-associated domain/translation elongation factor EF-Ts n=1 Tax=Quillaja saponaria TaxID=32244 RepID=A0AAD7VNB7_QUISA|nr:Ubiquitin-associated domain/translation elongation factor EF-Ts [Quillaja saponaria]
MSPSKSKSKSKAKSSARVSKGQQASLKSPGSTNTGSSSPANAYNPILGTFHTLETSSLDSSPPLHDNGRYGNIDDTDEHSSPHGTVSEYDSVSNNGSCSGESEEKIVNSTRPNMIPGSENDRREKIRLKNERKHQRQRERRAQELHDRCSGYLMSRKLEALSQQLVAMGFSSEKATLALMLNDGNLEKSVSWLFDASEEEARKKDTPGLGKVGNLKIDISDEFARISAMGVRYNCSKQEVERIVVACEGDLERAESTLKSLKQETPVTQKMPEDSVQLKNIMRSQELPAASVSIQQRRNERDFNYSKIPTTASMFPDPGSRNPQSSQANHLKALSDKRWATSAGSSPSTSLNLAPPMQVSPSSVKVEVRPSALGNEATIIQQGAIKEPVVMMQRPQSTSSKQSPVSNVSALLSATAGWYVNSVPAVDNTRSNGKLLRNQGTGFNGTANQSLEQSYHQTPSKEYPFMYGPAGSASAGAGFWNTTGTSSHSLIVPSEHQGSWNTTSVSSPSLTVPPSLGLFSGRGSAGAFGSSVHVDWNTGAVLPEFDYTSIDWTLDYQSSSKSSGLWLGISSLLRNSSGVRMGGNAKGSRMSGLQNGGMASETSSAVGLHEWTSPFAGKDIFSLPRQFVTSPSL